MKKIFLLLLISTTSLLQKSMAQTTNSKSAISAVLTTYIQLKNSLAADDSKTARTGAKALMAEIDKVPMDKMTSDQHTGWMKYVKKLSYDAEHIAGTNEIDHQREHFVSLSKNMYAVLKVIPPDSSFYYQFCPMANDGKGAFWVSEQEKIKNPYMGSKMPSCGSTKETLKK